MRVRNFIYVVVCLCSLLLSGEVSGNTVFDLEKIDVTGVLYDAETQEALIGASIIEEGTTNGTISDIDGSFSLTVSEGSNLEISYIGYKNKTVLASTSGMTIYLSKDAALLDEIVVVGYGSQKKSDLTGAISSIGIEEIKQLPATGLEQAIQG